MKKIVLYILALLIILSAIFLFIRKEKPSDVRVGYIPISDCAQLYVAQEKGFFKEENLNVSLQKLEGGAKILEALASQNIDVGFSNIISLILSNDAGLDFISIAGGSIEDSAHKFSSLMVPTNSNIMYPKDLEGKNIAINTKKNIVELAVIEILEKNGVDKSKVKFIEIPFPNMEKVLLTKSVDVIALVEPFVSFAIQNGSAKKFYDLFSSISPIVDVACYNASKKYIEKNPEIVNKFNKAIEKATQFIKNNQSETLKIVAKYANLTEEQTSKMILPAFGKIDQNRLQFITNKVFEKGWSKNKFDASTLIYNNP